MRYDAVQVAAELSKTLKSLKMKPSEIIINRAFPEDLANDQNFTEILARMRQQQDASFFANYLDNFIIIQRRVQEQLGRAAASVLTLPVAEHLDAQQELRQADLMALGQRIFELSGEYPP